MLPKCLNDSGVGGGHAGQKEKEEEAEITNLGCQVEKEEGRAPQE